MGFLSRSLTALVVASTLASARSVPASAKTVLIPRQASPGFAGCVYPLGWRNCNDKNNRDCWVISPTGKRYDVNTDYEDDTPPGIERHYDLEIVDKDISPDGTVKTNAQLVNGKYPGQLIEACWGDTLTINVKNSIRENGTTIHWHGIRQLGSNDMDGVNGVTQCPIANGDVMQYKFKLTQYGTTWYHSHYSLQYGEGLAGPMLIHGPNSVKQWDVEWTPLMINDWVHGSAYDIFRNNELAGHAPGGDTILVNGTGRFNGGGKIYENKFEPGKKYLIRIINSSVGVHFIWSIDNHMLTVVGTDLVAVKPYNTTSISVGIGQRYSVIVQANPDTPSPNGRYWMRTEYTRDGGCNAADIAGANTQDLQRTGIISYTTSNSTGDPQSSRHSDMKTGCADENQGIPVVPWNITGPPQNKVSDNTYGTGLDFSQNFHGFRRWDIADVPMWLNFSNPTLLNLRNTSFNPEYAVVNYNYNDAKHYVYMVITSGSIPGSTQNRLPPAPHPIHLHGHDFAIIGQSSSPWDPVLSPKSFSTNNPPRRDTAMLPGGGYLAIAFRPDNPGAWAVHCHIAWHASSGLAMQVLERQSEISRTIGGTQGIQQHCDTWKRYLKTAGAWDPKWQDDSGMKRALAAR